MNTNQARYTYQQKRKSDHNQEIGLLFALRAEHARVLGKEKAINFPDKIEAKKAMGIFYSYRKKHPSETLKGIHLALEDTRVVLWYKKPYSFLAELDRKLEMRKHNA